MHFIHKAHMHTLALKFIYIPKAVCARGHICHETDSGAGLLLNVPLDKRK